MSSVPHIQSSQVHHNITDSMDEFETFHHVHQNAHKYSSSHFKEIKTALEQINQRIRVVTFNVLFSLNDHHLDPKHHWQSRKTRVFEAIDHMNPDILSIQEPLDHQVTELKNFLIDYDYFGSKDNASMNHGIFYKKDRFECIEASAFHLESDQDEFKHVTTNPKWQSKRKELVHLKLMDKTNMKIIHVFNAHLSFFHPDWREMEAHIIHQLASDILDKDQKVLNYEPAAILMGDWNTFSNKPDFKDLPSYDGDRTLHILQGGRFKDTAKHALLGHIGALSTFTNNPSAAKVKPFEGTGNPGIILDHILCSHKVTPLLHAVNPIQIDGDYPSDHMPVVLDFFA